MNIAKIRQYVSKVDKENRRTRNRIALVLACLFTIEVGFMVGVNTYMEQQAAINLSNVLFPLFIIITLAALVGVWVDYRPNKTFNVSQCADGTTEVELDDVILVIDEADK